MYLLSRTLLRLTVVISSVCLGLLVILGWPSSGFVAGIVAVAMMVRRGRGPLTTLGSARWATEQDLAQAGMLYAKSGLVLGRMPVERGLGRALAMLFSNRVPVSEAFREFFASLTQHPSVLVRLPQVVHTAIYSPSGQGKGVSGVIPFLLTTDEACVVIDFKGENAFLTAEHRRRQFGHQVVLLDPYHVVTNSPDRFDPLDFVAADNPVALDECNDLAKALVIRSPDEREPHWSDSAELWISAMLATVVRYGEPGLRSIQTIREFLTNSERLEMATQLMCESDAWQGMLARLGGQLKHYVDREKSSTLSTVSRHLRFLDSPAIADSTRESTFDPGELRNGKMTIYLILPPDHMRAQSGLLRLWIGSLLRAVVRGGLQERNKVHFVLDEAASLGQLDAIEDAVDKYRGYGIRMQFYFQSLGQLQKCFPRGQDQTLLSNCAQVFMAVNDNQSADYISTRLGEQTIIVQSGGTSSSSSHTSNSGAHPSDSSGYTTTTNSNWQQQARKL